LSFGWLKALWEEMLHFQSRELASLTASTPVKNVGLAWLEVGNTEPLHT
jgi:hypothetical protein